MGKVKDKRLEALLAGLRAVRWCTSTKEGG